MNANTDSHATQKLSTWIILQMIFTGLLWWKMNIGAGYQKLRKLSNLDAYFRESLANMIRVKLTATRNRTSRSGVLTSEFAMANDGRCDYGSTRKRFVICGGRQLLGGGAIGKGLLWKVWINGESPLTVPNEPLSFEK